VIDLHRGLDATGEAEGATRLHYVVEDQQANRVALIPNRLAERHAGQEVVVVGSFQFGERAGRSIEIESIERRPIESPSTENGVARTGELRPISHMVMTDSSQATVGSSAG